MKNILFISLCLVFLSVSQNSNAQLSKLKSLKKKAASVVKKNNTNSKATKKVASGSMSSSDSESNSNNSENLSNENTASLGSGGQTKPKTGLLATSNFKSLQPIKDYGMTDGIHANHIGEVVFSKTPIRFSSGREDQLSRSFNLGDEIYFMAYFKHSYHNQCVEDKVDWIADELPNQPQYNREVIYFEVNGEIIGKDGANKYERQAAREHFQKWTGRSNPDGTIFLVKRPARISIGRSFLTYVAPKLKQGVNKIKMYVSFSVKGKDSEKFYTPSKPMAVGEFELNVKSTAMLKGFIIENGFKLESKQNNPALEKAVRSAYNGDKTIKKIVFRHNTWSIQREHGVITEKYIPLYLIYPKSDGTYEALGAYAIQDYLGGGKYSKTRVSLFRDEIFEVPAILAK